MSFNILTEIVNGECPSCDNHSLLVNVGFGTYRCVHCGDTLEQKVNGVIKYIKATKNTKFDVRADLDGQKKKTIIWRQHIHKKNQKKAKTPQKAHE